MLVRDARRPPNRQKLTETIPCAKIHCDRMIKEGSWGYWDSVIGRFFHHRCRHFRRIADPTVPIRRLSPMAKSAKPVTCGRCSAQMATGAVLALLDHHGWVCMRCAVQPAA